MKLKDTNLVRIAVKKALDSRLFKKIVVTTDYTKNKLDLTDLTSSALTTVIIHTRDRSLCTDKALMVDVVKDAVTRYGGSEPWVWLMQVTCPFTKIEDMVKIRKLLDSTPGINSLITFKPVKEHSNRTYSIKEKEDGSFAEAFKLRYTSYRNKQDLMTQYTRSGNIYVVRRECFEKEGNLEVKPIASYFVDRITGINIDDHEDVVLAKYWLNTGKVKI